jgi:ribosomal protein S18 acetylase RimI-like enzyme
MPRHAGPIVGLLSLTDPQTHIRRLTAADEAFCRALFHEQRAAQFAPLGLSKTVLHAMLDQQFEAQRIAYARQFPDAEQFIIEYAGADVGRVILAQRQRPEALSDSHTPLPAEVSTLHLVDITIVAAARCRGIGSDVIGSVARAAHALGATRFTLSVLQTNDAAQRLYERLGFVTATDGVHIAMVRHLD